MSGDEEDHSHQLPRPDQIRSRAPSQDGWSRVTLPPDVTPPPNVRQTLAEAMLTWGDPKRVADFLEHEQTGPLSTFASIFGKETDADRWALPYTRVTDELRDALIGKLRDGRLAATGFLQGAAPNAPPSVILAERWNTLTPDFGDSSATGSGIVLTGIRVSEPTIKGSAAPSSRTIALAVCESAYTIEVNGQCLVLAPRPLKLMVLLANAAIQKKGVVSRRTIEAALWSQPVANKACADAIRDLRKRLATILPKGIRVQEVIANRSPASYILDLDPDRIRLNP